MFLVSKFFVVKHTSPMKFVKVDAKIRPVVQFRKSALASGGPPNSLPALCLWTLYTGGTAVCQTTCFAVPTLDCCRRLCRRRTFRRFCKFSCSTITKYGVARKPPERCQHNTLVLNFLECSPIFKVSGHLPLPSPGYTVRVMSRNRCQGQMFSIHFQKVFTARQQ